VLNKKQKRQGFARFKIILCTTAGYDTGRFVKFHLPTANYKQHILDR